MNDYIINMIWVGTGGFIGSAARFSISYFSQRFENIHPNFSTLAVNLIGSLLLGIMSEYILENKSISQGVGLFLTVGLCGGFTTFSTFAYENILLLKEGHFVMAALYIFGSLIGGIVLFIFGMYISKQLL
ncbi:MAG: fluoride efflux transporter CrcB [Candidatus Kapabacteria bacterium]|nr:fluoride efflux transporter CrcB [Ignavibacteriota bacterium]MCW5883368.1 fluoride efflux transporter CrcB [Candidatus Kapabacteria bacterium]